MRSTAVAEEYRYFRERARDLLATARFTGDFELVPLRGGANNRVFRVQTDRGVVLLKAYYHDPKDERDRLRTEFAFSSFAWKIGLRCLPQPLAQDPECHLGLYEFMLGRSVGAGDVDEAAVAQAGSFYRSLNDGRLHIGAASLRSASEACFSLVEHLQRVEGRLDRLRCIAGESTVDLLAREVVAGELSNRWQRIVRDFINGADKSGLNLEERLRDEELRLSPSDFGFHNSLVTRKGELRFFDFEYAGWDDPGKLVCDFFCQRKVPVPANYFDKFVAAVLADLPRPEMMLTRINLLKPLYRFKWCCIMLNEFLPGGAGRRRFALPGQHLESVKTEQLSKVRAALREFTD